MQKKGYLLILGVLASGCAGKEIRPTAPMPESPQADAVTTPPSVVEVPVDPTFDIRTTVVKMPENSADYHFSMAQAYSNEGHPDRAIEEYKLALAYDTKSALIHARIAAEYIKKGMISEALESSRAAIKLNPDYVDARLMLAGLYSATRDVPAALAEYEKILKKNPTHEEAAIYRAQVLLEANQAAQSVQKLKTFLKLMPESALAWYYLGRTEQKLAHFQPAAVAYKRAIDLRPGFVQASLSLGFMYEEKQMNNEALLVYQDLFDQSQDSVAANRIATVHLKAERYQEAIPYLEAISKIDPDDLNAQVKLGLVWMELKQFDKAAVQFKAILLKNPESDRVHFYLGNVYEEQGKAQEAVSQLSHITNESKLYSDAVVHIGLLM